TIHVFHTRTGEARRLRGHRGAVLALAFAPARAGEPPLLVSVAQEPTPDGKEVAALRLWDLEAQKGLATKTFRPDFRVRPELAVGSAGAETTQLMVSAAWGDARLRIWDVARGELWEQKGRYSSSAVYLPGVGQLAGAVQGQNGGHIDFWQARSGEAPELSAHVIQLPDGHFPLSIRPLDAAAGKWGRAAIVARVPSQGDAYVLHVLDLDPGSRTFLVGTIPLW